MISLSRRAFAGGLAAFAAAPALARPAPPRVFAAGPPAAMLVWALRPQALLGWPRRLGANVLRYLPQAAAGLPVTGQLTIAGATANLEAVLAARPDFVLDYGDITPAFVALARRVEARIGVRHHLLDGTLDATPAAVRRAGALLAVADRAERLARFAEAALAEQRLARRRGDGPSFYYARGPTGLETGSRGSTATEVLEGAGWRNVIGASGRALANTSLERVAALDPAVVVTLDAGFAARAARDASWSRRRSGARRPIVLLADAPFGWIDRPPSLNRLLGCLWAAEASPLGPVTPRLRARTRQFHALVYGRAISQTEAAALMPRVYR